MDFLKTIYKDALIRLIIIIWAMIMVSFMTVMAFAFPREIPNSMVVMYGSGLTVLSGAIAFYEYLREKDNKLYLDEKSDEETK